MFSSRSFRNAIIVLTVAILAAGGVWASESARPRAGMLGSIPAKSLFCVRINNFDGTLDAVNEFLEDVAPESFDAKGALFSKLGSVLGDSELKGINKKGNIAIFAVNVPGDSAAPGPTLRGPRCLRNPGTPRSAGRPACRPQICSFESAISAL